MSDAISIIPVSTDSAPACRNPEREASLGEITRLLTEHFGRRPVSIYEAGGGSTSYIRLDGLNVTRITLVDIDPHQVARNDTAHEIIVGDLQSLRPKVSISSSATMSSNIFRGCKRRSSACRAC